MEAELAALAASGATTLVGLMVSESWEQAKTRLARLLGRRGATGSTEEELRRAEQTLATARSTHDDEAESRLRGAWQTRILDILTTDPDRGEELLRLLSELAPPGTPTMVSSVSGGTHHGPAFQGSAIYGGVTFHVRTPAERDLRIKPDQVPAVTARFINRSAELARLDEALGATGDGPRQPVTLGVVHGLSGIGKSALARWWAHKEHARFPDGQLYVDFAPLKGDTATPDAAGGDVSEAMAMVLRGLHVADEFMPASLAERTNLLRSRSAGQRLLVVLDGVDQPAQVRPFIPKGPGSAVLVTSHRRLGELALDGARLIDVRPLDTDGGRALLADLCGQHTVDSEPEAAARLVQLCSGLPVALRIVAARLLSDDGMTLAALAAELDDETGRLAGLSLEGEELSMSAALGPSYRLLAPEAARLYRLLGLLPAGPVDAAVAAAAAGTDLAGAQRLLRVLATAHLVETTPDGRHRMPDLVRLHAREQAAERETAEEHTAVTRRVATHYLALTAFADRAVKRNRLRIAPLSPLLDQAVDPFTAPGGPDPLEWLDAERTMILAVLREAARNGLHDLVWPLAEAFTVLFLHRRYLGAWKESLELGVAAAGAAGASAGTAAQVEQAAAAEARLRSLLSRPLMDLGEYAAAHTELETAVARADVTGNLVLRASVQEFLGRYLDVAEPDRAVEAYQRSLSLNSRAGEPRGAAIAAFFLGCAQDARGDHAQALATLLRARADLLSGGEPDPRMAARVTAAIGTVHAHLGDTEAAVAALSEAAGELRRQQAGHYEAQTLTRLADLVQPTGRTAEVRRWLTRALAVHTANGSPEAQELQRRLNALDTET
ncbi:NB-ARC domain-containing protein [Streptomyces shenzhenensis]|uniref:NB-ARC domain-containing protein n=1 Tax=Streptomyces shenzhenensis TaxID=943815 RepID=UPI003D8A3B6B